MRKYRVKQDASAPEKTGLEALAKLQAEQQEFLARGERATLAELEARMLRYETVLEKISQGICFFDANQRLLLSNRRYSEIYHLAPEDIRTGTTLRAITERRVALGTCLMTVVDDYLRWCAEVNSGTAAKTWTAELKDGRTIHICHQRMPDGGWVATHDDITQLKPKRAVVNELISLQALIDFVPDYLWVKDTESHFLVVNKALTADSGRARTSDLVGLSDFDIHAPDLAEGFFAREQEIFRTGEPLIDVEEHVLDAKGAPKWLLSTKVPLRNERNEIFGLVGIARDITERRQADTLRNGQAQILEMIARSADLEDVLDQLVCLIESQLNGIFGSVLLLDEDGQTLMHGAAPSLAEAYSKAIDGAKIGPTVGSCGTAIYHRKPVIVSDIMNDPLWADYRGLAAAHGYRSCWSTPILAHDGSVLGAFAMYSTTVREPTPVETRLVDIAVRIAGIAIERKHAEDRIRFLAHHDVLTGLPNRSLLNDRLTQAILQTQRHNPCVSVVFVDLDHFKNINDSLGHDAGDQLLKVVAARMVAAVRATDTVMRLGGDEFIILLSDQPDNPSMISATLNRIRATVAEPVVIEGRTLYITCSMGVATYPADSENPETLVRNADAAMYKAKDAGRDNVQFYTSEMNARIQEKLMLQKEIRDAIVRSQFILDYQPQIELRSGRIFAAEALIRWQHPTQGLLSPIKFIPIAEETGLIVQVGDWVLHEACRQNKAWQDQGLPPISVCVNVSARQFREKNLISRVVSALRESGLEAKFLELEITESLIMHDVDQAVATMQALRKLGVQLAIDDFGTGYSSLNALKTFPVARLKIDKSFISNITSSERDKAVASAVISLGQKLNLKVIAEGVETAEQVEFLRANNCDEIQGYYISKPVRSEAIEKLLKSQSVNVL